MNKQSMKFTNRALKKRPVCAMMALLWMNRLPERSIL